MTRLRAEETNGHAQDCDDPQSEILETVRCISVRLGHSPDAATGNPGSGLCRTVAELKAESDYQARKRHEAELRRETWRHRITTAAYLLTGLSILATGAWAIFRHVVLLVKP